MMNPGRAPFSTTICCIALVILPGALGCERKGTTQGGDASTPARAAPSGPTGSLEGRVHFSGEVPKLARLQTSEGVVRQCGNEVEDRSLLVGEGGAIVDAVASLQDAPAVDAADAGTIVIDQKGCVFLPAIVAARAGATIVMKNSDPLTHNVRANGRGRELYNVAMPITGMTLKRTLPKEPGIVKLHCDIHPWMDARVATFAHPWFAQSDAEGRFRIERVPAGHHTVTLWHPRLAPKAVEVDVPPNGSATIDVVWSAADLHALE